ncbi:S1 family peptidase [Streptomyces sp. NBC_00340]|uniref:trypsin-like peptidase domain-containing protein n=1 Tax=Streptomyces sp. NBC_00340 TaxID=2975716 RepID=UPI0022559458|nr:trypsin-like peptidase domain-containing protein [Streptomyces sp. NBC_00340]MCX5132292.1 S1 family peptidase [Streptomyces sp. NBC_00340]
MKRTRVTPFPGARRRPALLGAAVVLLAVTSSSVAVADDGPGPFGVTVQAAANARTARIGALFHGDAASKGGGGHFCTASVVHSAGHDLLITAAHCLDGGRAMSFAPGYRDGTAPYGFWDVRRVFLPDGWKNGRAEEREDSDIAFAVLGERDGKKAEDAVGGANAFAAHRATGATAVTVTGYPSSADTAITCTDKPTAQSRTQQRVACPDFAGGTSGSPWVNGDGAVVGVIGGHEQGGKTDDISYSAVFGTEAADLYREAGLAG